MAAKSPAEPSARSNRPDRRREIAGILLLAGALFSGLSVISMQVGGDPLMGPGGIAIATAFYGLFGFGGYLVMAAMVVEAVRCFRGRRLIDGIGEALGAALLICGLSVLLYLPFAGEAVTQHGPGGLFGEWLGELSAGFIGEVGAGLAGTTMLLVGILLVTDISLSQALVVVGWAAGHARRAIVAGAVAGWRVARAAFPEKDDAGEKHREREMDPDELQPAIAISQPVRGAAREEDDEEAVPSPMAPELSDAVRVGEAHRIAEASEEDSADAPARDQGKTLRGFPSPAADAERAAVAAVVAELAAVEQTAPEADDDEEDEDRAAAAPIIAAPAAPTPPPDAPIIVEPASVARLRHEAEAAQAEAADAEAAERSAEKKVGFIKLGEGAFKLPGTDLLEYIPPQAPDMDKQQLYDMAERLEQAMANYGVRGKVREIHMGPVVTMYEFAPAPGTRTGKIANLEKDLAMALEAQAVRIVAPIPGKAVVGVEVPNQTREIVYLKEILQDGCFAGAASKLQVALGKDIKGAAVSVNLSKMPHLLVAGTTGSGKSVAVNGMITSILYNASPEEVRFIMVDPKMLELSIYEGIPHLLLPVVTDPKKANLALRWAVDEMERRYELLAKTGVRDIASYNARVDAETKGADVPEAPPAKQKKIRVVLAGPDGTEQEVDLDADAEITVGDGAEGDTAGIVAFEPPSDEDLSDAAAAVQAAREKAAAEPKPTKLPYIVIVIDEFADLMMVAPKDVETSVARLAQKARAAGLHLILATQRPSVDVITGLIKANFPSRIALQVASKIDSRTILDQSGAETLLGNGDMLFSDRGTKLRRIHGAFLSDEEVHRVVDFLKQQAKPVYDMDILKPREEDAEEGGAPADNFHDELYDQAVAIVCDTRQASVSYIQRRLQIGYNRAARMVEQMERDGIVGPTNGAKPRDVLAPPGEYLSAGV
ncbi:MAG TPA: DNA translocase FtsK 4TM domain-containing protein [Polyangia bacterium]|nr:DNA translocase FtsK 4TM domain-containing protein [Polyangia bacterium]